VNDATFLIRGGIVLPLEGRRISHDPGSVLVVDGAIAAVGAIDEVEAHPAAAAAPKFTSPPPGGLHTRPRPTWAATPCST